MRRIPMTMNDWTNKLDGFLTLNDRDILNHAGKISHQIAKQIAEREYDKFHQQRLQNDAVKADEDWAMLSKKAAQLTALDKTKKDNKNT